MQMLNAICNEYSLSNLDNAPIDFNEFLRLILIRDDTLFLPLIVVYVSTNSNL